MSLVGLSLRSSKVNRSEAAQLFQYDPRDGFWFLNWGRNMMFPTEGIYHALVAASWLGIVTRRPHLTLWPVVALGATHPFNGAQPLSLITTWFFLLWGVKKEKDSLPFFLFSFLALLAFAFYYFIFLPGFACHRAISHLYALRWTLATETILFAYGPVALLAGFRLWRDGWNLPREAWFFLLAFFLSFFFANHHWVLPPHQPIHFYSGVYLDPADAPGPSSSFRYPSLCLLAEKGTSDDAHHSVRPSRLSHG